MGRPKAGDGAAYQCPSCVLTEGFRVRSWPGSLCLCPMVPRDKICVHLSKRLSMLLWEKKKKAACALYLQIQSSAKRGMVLGREERAGWALGLGEISTTVVRYHALEV